METRRAANSACSLPPCGGGLGRGGRRCCTETCPPPATPTPNPSPQGPTRGRGAPPGSRRRCASTSPECALTTIDNDENKGEDHEKAADEKSGCDIARRPRHHLCRPG